MPEFDESADEPGDFDSDFDSAKGEDVVVDLVHQFLISVAYLARDFEDRGDDVDDDFGTLGFTARRQPYDVNSFQHKFKAINDGSIVPYRSVAGTQQPLSGYKLYCSVEARDMFTGAEQNDNGDDDRTVSDDAFAQCFAQMLRMIHAQSEEPQAAALLLSQR